MTLVLLGGGGHASDVAAVIEALIAAGRTTEPIVVADDTWARRDRFDDRPAAKLVDGIEAGAELGPFLVAIGYPPGRRAVHDRAVAVGGVTAPAAVHPSADVAAGVEIAPGVVVMGQTWISAKVTLGRHTHVGYGVTIGHDTVLGEFCAVMPGASIGGDTTVGDDVLVGAGATVLQGLTIGGGAVIGAGAVVVGDVEPGVTVVGVPARPR